MNFLYPEWFYALIFIPLIIIGAILMRSNRSKVWKQLVGDNHQQKLINTSSKLMSWLSFGVSLIALTGFIIAMTRPYYGQTTVRDKVKTRNIIIAVDCSLSMLCKDGDTANTSRLNTAKAAASKLVDAFPDDHIGVMAFAGSANMISSITIDHPSVKNTINQIDINSAHTLGSNFSNSVKTSIAALERGGKPANALIFITDGTEDKPDISDLAQKAKNAQVQIFTIGVGTSAGGEIPIELQNGKVIKHLDQYGRVVITKLVDSALRQLANETNGSYSHVSGADKMIASAVNKMSQFEKEGRIREVPNELYQWFLAPSIILLVISVMLKTHWQKVPSVKAIPTLVLLLIFILPNHAEAQQNDSFTAQAKTMLFEKPEQIREGYKALDKKDYDKAIKSFNAALAHSDGDQHAKLSLALAQAYYRNKEFKNAAKAYGNAIISSDEQVQINAQYNMANALFRAATAELIPSNSQTLRQYLNDAIRGKKGVEKLTGTEETKTTLRSSIAKYDETLQADHTHTQAQKNKAIAEDVLSMIEEIEKTIQQEKESEEKKEEEKTEQDKKKEKESKEEKDEDKNDKPKEKGEDPKDQESGKEKEKGEEKGKGQPDEKGDPKESTESNRNPESKPEKVKDSQQTEKEGAANGGEFETEEEALEFMKRMSDQRKKPIRLRRNWGNNGNDW